MSPYYYDTLLFLRERKIQKKLLVASRVAWQQWSSYIEQNKNK